MTEETSRRGLHLVRSSKHMEVLEQDLREGTGTQGMLFPLSRHGVLIFIHFPDVTEQEFRATIEHAQPSFILELRSSPRFDIGRLNRQLAFQAFQNQKTRYLDLTSSLMGRIDAEAVLSSLRTFLRTTKPSFDRPVVFLMNRSESDEGFLSRVLDTVASFHPEAPQVYEVPK